MEEHGLDDSSILPGVNAAVVFPAGGASWAVVAPGAKLVLSERAKSAGPEPRLIHAPVPTFLYCSVNAVAVGSSAAFIRIRSRVLAPRWMVSAVS